MSIARSAELDIRSEHAGGSSKSKTKTETGKGNIENNMNTHHNTETTYFYIASYYLKAGIYESFNFPL